MAYVYLHFRRDGVIIILIDQAVELSLRNDALYDENDEAAAASAS